jgi:hypothetical protein
VKSVPAASASAPAIGEMVEFAIFTGRTMPLMVFPAKIQEKPARAFF